MTKGRAVWSSPSGGGRDTAKPYLDGLEGVGDLPVSGLQGLLCSTPKVTMPSNIESTELPRHLQVLIWRITFFWKLITRCYRVINSRSCVHYASPFNRWRLKKGVPFSQKFETGRLSAWPNAHPHQSYQSYLYKCLRLENSSSWPPLSGHRMYLPQLREYSTVTLTVASLGCMHG